METQTITDRLQQVDTTSERSGYPSHLRVAFTADTMAELRQAKEDAEAAGMTVTPCILYRRDGWALWHRQEQAFENLDDDRWARADEHDWTITINEHCDRIEEAFDAICGRGYEVEDAADLMANAAAVKELAEELADPDGLEHGESVTHFLDSVNGWGVRYSVKTGQNGYCYDTHQHCIGLLIEEPEQDEDEDEDEDNEA